MSGGGGGGQYALRPSTTNTPIRLARNVKVIGSKLGIQRKPIQQELVVVLGCIEARQCACYAVARIGSSASQPVIWSLVVYADVLVAYEKPTPAGASR